jgi:hypothetical protein
MISAVKVVVFGISCLSLLVFFTGCSSNSNPSGTVTTYPEITGYTPKDSLFDIPLGHSIEMSVTATDSANDSLTYTWHAAKGSIVSDSSHATFAAPDTPGLVTITVTISDDKGRSVIKRWAAGAGMIHVQGTISTPTTWQADTVYVVKGWVLVDTTLVIRPGVIVKFSTGAQLTTSSSGTITANGTASHPITFTSLKDTTGGDDNGDSTANLPARGDWNYVDISGGNGSVFTNCNFYYSAGGLIFDNSRGTVDSCVFAHNLTGLDLSGAIAGTVARGDTMFDNQYPMSANTGLDLDGSNIFHNPADSTQKNTYQGIFVGSGYIDDTLTWNSPEVAIVIDRLLTINSTLNITAGTILKFKQDAQCTISQGGTLNGINGAGTFFTSYKDDTLGGDANGDGTATKASAGDWDGILDNNSSSYASASSILFAAH